LTRVGIADGSLAAASRCAGAATSGLPKPIPPVLGSAPVNRRRPGLLKRSLVAGLFAVCCSSSVAVWAAPLSEVEDLIRRGTELRRKGEDATALPLYQKAYELAGGTPRTAAQLGLVEMALDYRIEAEGHLTEALSARNEIWINRNRAVLEEALRGVKAGIGALMVTGSPTGAEVIVAGRPLGKLPLAAPVRVLAGRTKVEVRAQGYTAASVTVVVPGQGQEYVVLNLAATQSALPAAGLESPRPGGARTGSQSSDGSSQWGAGKIAGATLIATGGAAVAGGATLLLFDKKQSCSVASAEDQCDRRTNTRVPGWSLIGGGIVAALVGVWVFRSSSSEVSVGVGPSTLVVSGRL
jgi:hypothetical protein